MSAGRIGSGGTGAPLTFTFDGRRYAGRSGDTIASALLANGVRIVGRSFKYHRPRGIFGAWTEEPNAIVDVQRNGRRTPNLRATTELLAEGMDVLSVNAWPSAERDRLGLLDRIAPLLPSGFYYKTFIWPNWHLYEPRIRAMAGLGRLDPGHEPPADCPLVNDRCDTLVIGAGPAGLAAAEAELAAGNRIVLVDDQVSPGGSLLHRPGDGKTGSDEAMQASLICSQVERSGGRFLPRTTAYGIYDHNLVCCWQRRTNGPDRQWRIRPRRIVLATGAIERPLVFPDNDRPGVMLAEAALFYLRRHDVLVGSKIVVATNNDRAYEAASALAAAGAEVSVADLRQQGGARLPGGKVRCGATVEGVHGAKGVEAVVLNGERVEADCLLVSGGFTPTVHLFAQARGRLRYDEQIAAFVPADQIEGISVVGAAAGHLDGYSIEPAWPRPGSKKRQWIDLQNDVTLHDVELAARENFRSVEHLKRYTTLGMATDQGKTSNMNGLAAMAAITGRTIAETGTTTYRPPFTPVLFTVVAGRRRGELFNPVRRLVLEPEHRAAGAVFREYGGLLRPAYYGSRAAEVEILREALQARQSVAIFDGSPLGKIEIFGPQAHDLVDFNAYQTVSTLKPGRIRYVFMLTERGTVYDDGVISKLEDEHYVVSCSSGHVQGVLARLEEYRQDRFDRSQVAIHNLTPQWATLTLCGPRAGDLAEALSLGADLSDAVLPHMAVATGVFENAPVRIARVSFTGDRSYEISLPSSKAPSLWRAAMEAGKRFEAVPIGSEALLLLRAEKGYVIVGKDTDGRTMPHDLGVLGPRNNRKSEFAGKRSLFTENAMREDRLQFVGLTVCDGGPMLPTGAHAVETAAGRKRSAGFVTSSYFSPTLQRPIALGLIENGSARMGEEEEFFHLGTLRRATISHPCAFDPNGERLNG